MTAKRIQLRVQSHQIESLRLADKLGAPRYPYPLAQPQYGGMMIDDTLRFVSSCRSCHAYKVNKLQKCVRAACQPPSSGPFAFHMPRRRTGRMRNKRSVAKIVLLVKATRVCSC